MNRIFFRIFPLTLLAIAVAAFAIYFAIRQLFGDPLEEIARKQASGPIFLLEHYIDQAPADEWLVRLNRVREVSDFKLEIVPLASALAAAAPDKREALQRGDMVLDIPGRFLMRRVDLKGERYVGSEEDVLQVSGLPIDVGLELKMEGLRYAIVALFLLIPIAWWSHAHWRELVALSRVAEELGAGKLSVRAATKEDAGVYPLAQCMNRMAERIEGLLEAQRQLMHSVSHELRTPISRIEFGLELLRGHAESEGIEERIRSMEEDLHELNALVNELLGLAGLERQQGIETEAIPLAAVLQECAAKLGHAFAGKRLRVEVAAEIGEVNGDRKLLARAVSNLLLNAARYAEHRVELHARRLSGTQVEIVIEDDGPGIPPEESERIFEPFYRLDRSRDRATGGFGLGLAIARKAVQLHGGRIEAGRSSLGGARFVLSVAAAPENGQKKSLPV